MIIHKIITEKPRFRVVNQPTHTTYQIGYNQYSQYTVIKNQEDFNDYLNKNHFDVGDIVKSNYIYGEARTLFSLWMVMHVETDFNNIPSWERGRPRILKLLQLSSVQTATAYMKYDVVEDFVLINDEEYNSLVEPISDYLQNHYPQFNPEKRKTRAPENPSGDTASVGLY